jgi:hypothetical protein
MALRTWRMRQTSEPGVGWLVDGPMPEPFEVVETVEKTPVDAELARLHNALLEIRSDWSDFAEAEALELVLGIADAAFQGRPEYPLCEPVGAERGRIDLHGFDQMISAAALAAREEPALGGPMVDCPMCDGDGVRPHSGHDDAGVYPDCLACEGHGDVTPADALLVRVMMYMTPSTRKTTWFATRQRIALAEDLNSYFDRRVPGATREDTERPDEDEYDEQQRVEAEAQAREL